MSDEHPPTTPTPDPVGYATYPTPAGPLQTGLAVTTLVLGILGFFMCPLAGIAAIITGIIALNRTSREPNRYGGRGMAIGGLVCGGVSLVCVVPLGVSILLPSLSRARELSKRLVCQSNMLGIDTSIRIYVNDHSGEGFPSVAQLVQSGDIVPQQTMCPSADVANYVMVPAKMNQDGTIDPQSVVMYEPKSNHGDEGGNVVFSDGHASFIRGDEYDRLIEPASSGSP